MVLDKGQLDSIIINSLFKISSVYLQSQLGSTITISTIGNLLCFTENLDLKRTFSDAFRLLRQDNCKIGFLARRLGTSQIL